MKYMMLVVSDPDAADRPSDPAVDDVQDYADEKSSVVEQILSDS